MYVCWYTLHAVVVITNAGIADSNKIEQTDTVRSVNDRFERALGS